ARRRTPHCLRARRTSRGRAQCGRAASRRSQQPSDSPVRGPPGDEPMAGGLRVALTQDLQPSVGEKAPDPVRVTPNSTDAAALRSRQDPVGKTVPELIADRLGSGIEMELSDAAVR